MTKMQFFITLDFADQVVQLKKKTQIQKNQKIRLLYQKLQQWNAWDIIVNFPVMAQFILLVSYFMVKCELNIESTF